VHLYQRLYENLGDDGDMVARWNKNVTFSTHLDSVCTGQIRAPDVARTTFHTVSPHTWVSMSTMHLTHRLQRVSLKPRAFQAVTTAVCYELGWMEHTRKKGA
jgi:hypothetical protein